MRRWITWEICLSNVLLDGFSDSNRIPGSDGLLGCSIVINW